MLACLVLAATAIRHRSWPLAGAALAGLALLLFFFRTWRGTITAVDHLTSPCDGTVLRVVLHPSLGYAQVAVFLNLHNIHVQYAPCDGIVTRVAHTPGKFHPAYLFDKGPLNERVETTLDTRFGRVYVVQIAGMLARRIASFVGPGNPVVQGQALGLIKFGSRVDLWIPTATLRIAPHVRAGARVRIGDPLARPL